MLRVNSIKVSNHIYLTEDQIKFESSLQQLLQQQSQLLRLLNQQNRWQIWISARPMLKRSWLKQSGLSEKKVINFCDTNPVDMVRLIEKALLSKTASYVVACIEEPLSHDERHRLQNKVKESGTQLFLIDDNNFNYNNFTTLSLTIVTVNKTCRHS